MKTIIFCGRNALGILLIDLLVEYPQIAKYNNFHTVDVRNPALPIVRKAPKFPQFRVLKVMLRIKIINRSSVHLAGCSVFGEDGPREPNTP